MPSFLSVKQFEIGELKNFIYLILDHSSKKAAIVDPQKDLRLPLEYLTQNGFTLTSILLTHTHHDHIAGVPELIRTNPELLLYVHEKDFGRLSPASRDFSGLQKIIEGQRISLGAFSIRVMHTPGHTSGECCYYLEAEKRYLFTGDTLFIRDCGRTDFETGSNEDMFASLQKIKALPTDTIILPGHHYREEFFSTLEAELRDSPPLRCKDVHELAALP